jgi:hypothetical protein
MMLRFVVTASGWGRSGKPRHGESQLHHGGPEMVPPGRM